MLQDVWLASLDGPEIIWDRVSDKSPEEEILPIEEEEEVVVEETSIMGLFKKKHQKKRKKKKKKRRKKKDRRCPEPRKGHLALYVETGDRQLMVGPICWK